MSYTIKQVIINIISNAIKFSPDGSIINVRSKEDKDFVLIEIQDFGRGIPTNKQKKIFIPEFEASASAPLWQKRKIQIQKKLKTIEEKYLAERLELVLKFNAIQDACHAAATANIEAL